MGRREVAADELLLVFVKYPVEGQVKTRLAATIGHEAACALYRCFVTDTMAMSRKAGYGTRVCFHPPEAAASVGYWLGADGDYQPQKGADLGERMSNAFAVAFRQFTRVVLMGSDAPDLPAHLIDDAFEKLKTCDAVIGPAHDGGYYLIGFSAAGFQEAPFRGVPWGTAIVFEATIAILKQEGARFHILPQWRDVDDLDDLKALYCRQMMSTTDTSATRDFLRNHFHRHL
jgi:uncharacterized protein